jgi:hypothetical protein
VTRLLAATGDDVVLLTRARAAWACEVVLRGRSLQCLAVDPRAPSIVVAGSRSGGVWRSDDSARTWRAAGLEDRQIFSVAVSPADGAVYAGCEPSALFVLRDGGPWEELTALQDIPSRPTWSFPPRPWTSHVRWIAPSPHDAELVLVGIELGGLMRSPDGGQTFSDHRPGAQRDVHCLAWHPTVAGRAYETGGGGTAWSRDGGLDWEAVDAGRDRNYTWALAVDPGDPERWYCSASPGPFRAHGDGSADAYVYRLEPDGRWHALDGGLPRPLDSMPYALVFVEGTLFAGLRDGRVYATDDRGDSWRALELRGEPPRSIVALANAGLN